MAPVLSRQTLNRALLSRQLLLERARIPVHDAVAHLFGLQAQAPNPPYVALWNRLADFVPGELSQLITDRRVVRIALMRSTIHLVTAEDCLALRAVLAPALERALAATRGKELTGLDVDAVAAYGRELVEAQPRTFAELGTLLAARFPGQDAEVLPRVVRVRVPLVQVPPRGLWGSSGQAAHTSAESWLSAGLSVPSADDMVLRYLAAYGPASVRDVQAWAGMTRLKEVVERLRPRLSTFRDEQSVALFDLPDAPRPDADVPAPVRLLGEFDSVLLAHADRTRIISDEHRKRIFTINGIIRATVLIGGFVAGMWRIERERGRAVLAVEPFTAFTAADRDAVAQEGARLLAFAAPEAAAHEVRIA
ncbi:winged helix DNA-binding domain-containing protein [Catellatospora vulcania]|uniref:winged helix DNA-binding domain-containing protein n=1 Tax=Catellatospora vulcania TaxID=1460450 RepID=UPI0012D37F88|nr:winged helix DNA-binding domain-containing protein [Catellatospora vulcania]